MSPRRKSLVRFIVSILAGFVVGVGSVFAVCILGGDHACQNLIWPAAMILGTGFEGQLLAAGVTILGMTAVLALTFWFVFSKWTPLKDDFIS